METPEINFEGKKKVGLLERQEIIAPPNFVSVYHETKEESLPSIDQGGLKVDIETKNIGEHATMQRRNTLIDALRPEELKAKGISRSNIYAYPFLEHGHGLFGADQRFIRRDERDLRDSFERFQKYSPDFLKKLGTATAEEYIRKMTDPSYLKSEYPGEVIEMKVDPDQCYVGDLYSITLIMEDMRWFTEQEAIKRNGKKYWDNLVTLKDFITWYRRPEYAENGNDIQDAEQFKDGEDVNTMMYCLLKDAPDTLPKEIKDPEILIPRDIPQDHIKLVK
jgi:hypothetical protein